jgi:hypothetical protein
LEDPIVVELNEEGDEFKLPTSTMPGAFIDWNLAAEAIWEI